MTARSRQNRQANYDQAASAYALTWLAGTLPDRSSYKTLWRCSKALHTFWQSLDALYGCPICQANELAEQTGSTCISLPLPNDPAISTSWRCAEGHTFDCTLETFYRRQGNCPICSQWRLSSNPERNTVDQHLLEELAKARNLIWCGPQPEIHIFDPTLWECHAEHHSFSASYRQVQKQGGIACPQCHKKHLQQTRLDTGYRTFAKAHNLIWLATTAPKSRKGSTRWQCAVGHEFDSSCNTILRHPAQPCPRCRLLNQTSSTAAMLQRQIMP